MQFLLHFVPCILAQTNDNSDYLTIDQHDRVLAKTGCQFEGEYCLPNAIKRERKLGLWDRVEKCRERLTTGSYWIYDKSDTTTGDCYQSDSAPYKCSNGVKMEWGGRDAKACSALKTAQADRKICVKNKASYGRVHLALCKQVAIHPYVWQQGGFCYGGLEKRKCRRKVSVSNTIQTANDDIKSFEADFKNSKTEIFLRKLLLLQKGMFRDFNTHSRAYKNVMCKVPIEDQMRVKLIWDQTLPMKKGESNLASTGYILESLQFDNIVDMCKSIKRKIQPAPQTLENNDILVATDIDDTLHPSHGMFVKRKFKGQDYREQKCWNVRKNQKWLSQQGSTINVKNEVETTAKKVEDECYFDRDTITFHQLVTGTTGNTILSSARPTKMMSNYKKYSYPLISKPIYTFKGMTEPVKSIYIQGGSLTGSGTSGLLFRQTEQLKSLQEFNDQNEEMKVLGQRKMQQFERMMRAYPELCGKVAFIGDDGQGDYKGMELMLKKEINGVKCLLFAALKSSAHLHLADAAANKKIQRREWKHNGGFDPDRQGRMPKRVIKALKRKHNRAGHQKRFFVFQHYKQLYKQLNKKGIPVNRFTRGSKTKSTKTNAESVNFERNIKNRLPSKAKWDESNERWV